MSMPPSLHATARRAVFSAFAICGAAAVYLLGFPPGGNRIPGLVLSAILLAISVVMTMKCWRCVEPVHDRTNAGMEDSSIDGDIFGERGARHDRESEKSSAIGLPADRSDLDETTGLPDRAAVELFLRNSLADSGIAPGKAAVISIGFDNLTPASDTLGRAAGDELLRGAVARIRRSAFRDTADASEVAEPANGNADKIMLARGSGNELIAAFAGPPDVRELQRRAKSVVAALCEPLAVDGAQVRLGVRVGIARAPDDSLCADELIRCAGMAMRADAVGAARWVFYQPRHRDKVRTRLVAESELRAAIARDDLHVVYQPKIDVRTSRLVGVEALMRMRDTSGQLRGPGTFIDIAEQTGLIVEVGAIVLRKAAEQCKRWSDAGLQIPVAVNASPIEFSRPRFTREVLDTVARSAAIPELMEIELTESTATEDIQASRRRIRQLREGGLRVAIDDFGTGYSNIAQFAQLEFDTLKIDRSIVELIGKGHRGEAVLAGILGIAASIGHKVVAEGIETRQQLAFLRKHGCPVAQGFLFGRPMPADDLIKWVETQKLTRSR